MKTREFDINNYKVDDIIKEAVVQAAKEFASTFTHPFIAENNTATLMYMNSTYHVKFRSFADMSKTEQKQITKLAKEQYEAKKAKTISDWKTLKEKCDNIFHDDKEYAKLLPELEPLYCCQAHTALLDFYSKKIRSKAVSNAKYQARAMKYSQISCD